MLLGLVPFLLDVGDVAADADAVDFLVGRKNPDRYRHVVLAALAVGDVLEQESLALILRNAAAKLPAHQRVHFGVLVDRPLDAQQQSLLVEVGDVGVKVGVLQVVHKSSRAVPCGIAAFVAGS